MMRTIILLLLLYVSHIFSHPHAISNGREDLRRLGDNITTISKTCYFADKFNLSMYYTPFEYSDSFELCNRLPLLTDSLKNKFSKIVFIKSEHDIENAIKEKDPLLFVCTFLSPTPSMYHYLAEHDHLNKQIKDLFTPLKTSSFKKDQDSTITTIALHVRKGGGFDWPLASQQEFKLEKPVLTDKKIFLYKKNPGICSEDIWPLDYVPGPGFISETKHLALKKKFYADYIWPIKFPPDQYYIEQLKFVLDTCVQKTIVIHLFTDDPEPETIVKRYKKALENYPNISFIYRTSENMHNKNVIDDLMAIAQCDILIAANSSFALAATLLGNHSLIIMPVHAVTLPDKVIIDKIQITEANLCPDSTKKEIKMITRALNNFIG